MELELLATLAVLAAGQDACDLIQIQFKRLLTLIESLRLVLQ